MNERLKGMIGLAVKAGKTVSGSFAVEGAVKRRKARLVIIDGRASPNTLRQIDALCEGNGVRRLKLPDAGVLEALLGRDNRTVMAVLDGGFAEAILEISNKE